MTDGAAGHEGPALPEGGRRAGLGGVEVGEEEAFAVEGLANGDGDGAGVVGAVPGEGVEFAVFAAGVGGVGEVGEEIVIEFAAGEFGGDFGGVEAGDGGADAAGDDLAGKVAGVHAPEGEEGLHVNPGHLALAVGADIGEGDVAEDDFGDGEGAGALQGGAHDVFVLLLGAGGGDEDAVEGEAEGGGLRLEKGFPDAVHGDAVVGFGDAGEESDDVEVAGAAGEVERPEAVFAAAPGHPRPGGAGVGRLRWRLFHSRLSRGEPNLAPPRMPQGAEIDVALRL